MAHLRRSTRLYAIFSFKTNHATHITSRLRLPDKFEHSLWASATTLWASPGFEDKSLGVTP